MEHLHLIVGLGNPGGEYARTRHNAGFRLVEELARRWGLRWDTGKAFNARLARTDRQGKPVMLCEPLSFMNASGEVVRAVADYFEAAPSQVLVTLDDADLPLGEIRMRSQGGSGGHHGLESIFQHLGSQRVARLRMGIGRTPEAKREITGHVLGQFSRADADLFEKVLVRAADQAECWLDHGLQKAMNQFNGVIDPAEAK
jgi:peptidyl-tRNA hydrolase, PTH1 family